MVEGGLLTLLAPSARSVAPQVTAPPSLAAYHDLRWMFAGGLSWLWFVGLLVLVLAARSALDVALLRLAWPRGVPGPRTGTAFVSCAALTLLAWVLLLPAATLALSAAVLPFSWPFLAAFPIMLGIVAALSHGGVMSSWWRRLPAASAVGWLMYSFAAATAAAAVIAYLPAGGALVIVGLAGLVNARAWYGLAGLAARVQPRAHESVPARLLFSLPFAPVAAVTVVAIVVGVARLMFTGTIQLPISPAQGVAVSAALSGQETGQRARSSSPGTVAGTDGDAVLVVGGWGSWCCDAANSLHAALPGVPVRQFSYLGLGPNGKPRPGGGSADDLPLPALGDRIAAQVGALHAVTGRPVDVVAESEGTLGVYAMLARHRHLPVAAVALLSPIVSPGQLSYQGPDGASVSQEALEELNRVVGGMSPYGPSGAKQLLASVSEYGARYFEDVVAGAHPSLRWLAVIPLADAVTLPDCALPADVVVVNALHGGLLGDPAVFPMVRAFVSGQQVTAADDGSLRKAAELIDGAAAAWRMPDTRAACPMPAS